MKSPLVLPPTFAFNRAAFEAAFRDFLDHVTILSKASGYTPFRLFDLPWAPGLGAQEYVLKQILDGLEADIHYFVVYKSRQVGITTIDLLFDFFWCGLYPGLQGAIVTDTDPNKEKLRLLLGGDTSVRNKSEGRGILDLLPPTHRLRVVKHNANGIVFENGSMLDYLVAGTKKRNGSLGRSRALNFCHATEVAQYGDEESFESLVSSFSSEFPARFYMLESTAHGYNLFNNQWEDAKADEFTKKAIFIGWWQHPGYIERQGTRIFERYGYATLSDDERETDEIVKRDFGYEITREQWAWYRHRKDPQRRAETGEIDAERAEIIEVEYPSYPEQGFRLTGSPFFSGKTIDVALKRAEMQLFKGYYYHFGENFTESRRTPVNNSRLSQLKIWHEPHPNGVYIAAFDPSYGRGKKSDRHCIEILRCYADRLIQCAEFCVAQLPPFQATWVLLDLCGWYRNARWIVEIDGPGEAVMGEFRHLKTLLDTGRLKPPPGTDEEIERSPEEERKRSRSWLQNVREYLYHRPDALTSGYNMQWKTTGINKPVIMTQLQDHFLMDHLVINSVPALHEMRKLVRDDTQIEGEGKHKDDRPVALAMGVRCWLDWERRDLDAQGRTYAREQAQDEAMGDTGDVGMMRYVMMQRAAEKRAMQRMTMRSARRTNWGW
jgi:hypothetical protein